MVGWNIVGMFAIPPSSCSEFYVLTPGWFVKDECLLFLCLPSLLMSAYFFKLVSVGPRQCDFYLKVSTVRDSDLPVCVISRPRLLEEQFGGSARCFFARC